MNPWLERALVSWAAGAVATTVIVTTAKNPNKKKKRRKKGKKKKGGDGIEVSKDDSIPRSTGAQAAHDYRMGTEQGLTAEQFVENVKGLGDKAKKAGSFLASSLFGGGEKVPKKDEGDHAAADRAGEGEKERGRAGEKKRPDRDEQKAREPDVVSFMKEEAKKAVRDSVVQDAAEKTGVAGVVDELKEQGGEIKDKAAKVVQGIKDAIPEDAGERLKAAGTAVADAGKKAGAALKDAVSEEKLEGAKKKLDQGLKNIGRWFQGPGAPREEPPADVDVDDEKKNGEDRGGPDDAVDARID